MTKLFLILENVIRGMRKMSAKIKIYDLFNYKSIIYILGIQLFTIVFIFQTTINKLQHSRNIQLINNIKNIIKFVNVFTIGKRNKYILIIGKNKYI